MNIDIVRDIVIILALGIAVLLICHRLRIPSIVGLLLTGVVSGPHGLGIISQVKNVEILAQVGVILLLFSIGMQFSFRHLLDLKRFFFLGGPLQVVLTSLAAFSAGRLFGLPFAESIFLGWLVSLSSTAIVLDQLEKRKEIATPYGHITAAILIFQDIAAVLMMITIPFLVGKNHFVFSSAIFWELGKGVLLVGGVVLSAEKLIPWLLYYVFRTRIRELFLLTLLFLCILVAWITSSMGLSLSIGAFLAGLAISETEYSHNAIGDILPFKALFTSFFFVSIGMLLESSFLFQQPFLILLITLAIILLKVVTGTISVLFLGIPVRTAVHAALILAQIGEFSFVLATEGRGAGIFSEWHYQLFLSFAILSMIAAPFLLEWSHWLSEKMAELPWPQRLKTGMAPLPTSLPKKKMDGHVIIVGYGLCGQYLTRACREAEAPYVILEMDPQIVRQEKRKGEPILFGDAAHESVLSRASIETARVLAVVINDLIAAQRIVHTARLLNSSLFIIIRTRTLKKMAHILNLGADVVVPDEFSSSIEIFSRVMQHFQVPGEEIQRLMNEIRVEEKIR